MLTSFTFGFQHHTKDFRYILTSLKKKTCQPGLLLAVTHYDSKSATSKYAVGIQDNRLNSLKVKAMRL